MKFVLVMFHISVKLKLFHNNNFYNFITQPCDCFFFTRAEWSRTLTNRMMSVLIC